MSPLEKELLITIAKVSISLLRGGYIPHDVRMNTIYKLEELIENDKNN